MTISQSVFLRFAYLLRSNNFKNGAVASFDTKTVDVSCRLKKIKKDERSPFDVEQPRMMYGPIIDGWAALGDGDEAAKWLSQAEAEGLGKNKDSQKKVHTFEFGDVKNHSKRMWNKCGANVEDRTWQASNST